MSRNWWLSLRRQAYRLLLAECVREEIRQFAISGVVMFGDSSRVSVDDTARLNNALLNTISGNIVIGPYVFCGHNVCLLTGTHDVLRCDEARQVSYPTNGRDIIVERGVWLGSNATILGPCTIGEHSVVAAGAVVTKSVPRRSMVAGVPARIIKSLDSESAPGDSH